jgi:hypothetical protein
VNQALYEFIIFVGFDRMKKRFLDLTERRMTMNDLSNCKLKKLFMCLFCLGLLLIFSGPGMAAGLNLASSVGTAEITWSPAAAPKCWNRPPLTDPPTPRVDVLVWQEKNSFSSAWSGVNAKDTGPGQSDYFEDTPDTHDFINDLQPFPSWRATYFTAPFFGFSGSATGIGDTNSQTPVPVGPGLFPAIATRNYAKSDVSLKKFGDADVFIAQSVLEGLFTVDEDCDLEVSATYVLTQNLKSLFGFVAYSSVAASFTVYNLNVNDPTGLGDSFIVASTSATVPPLENATNGRWYDDPPLISQSNPLVLTVALSAMEGSNIIQYDFEAAASTVASAAAPFKPVFFPWGWWWLNNCRGQWN